MSWYVLRDLSSVFLNLFSAAFCCGICPRSFLNFFVLLLDRFDSVFVWISILNMVHVKKKTKCMLFGTPTMLRNSGPLNLQFQSNNIEQVNVFKYLGVLLDNTLNFGDHTSMVCQKISSRLGVLKRVKAYLPHKQRIMVFNSLVLTLIMLAVSGPVLMQNIKEV